MMSRERKKATGSAALHDKLQILRSITHSNALSENSILMDASEYIKKLKLKVVKLNQEIACEEDTLRQTNPTPTDPIRSMQVTVETLGRHGSFAVNVFSDKNCPGLLVSILQAFDDLGLNVLEATASCADTFHLEAVGGENTVESVDEHLVKQAVLQAIRNCPEGGPEQE
ncbi:hypothetical protein QOZ80_7AG0581670 [Eleusine coracana subsp. coracana]|uniref:Plant bHLH transcription factor ACT-like domain-containing protein n=1 Tax=Eleusine coracana subsp. coracana TaxID=191504 RepID=A0AAV9FU54_ELECO|nr:hypothetical protein QOZ80_UnG0728790 [Eleusine coracana subsp. coracana]KAK3128031.1 hypothetical protein QOZ80_7AG0581670 [Eleusine coracana subsp. coracana]